MSTIGMILQVVGVVIGLVGGIWLLVVAFQESIGWGIGCLLCGLVGIIFAIQHWEKAKKPFLIERIESEETAGVFEVRLPKETKAVHVVPLAIIAPQDPGAVDEEFTVTISESSERLTFKAHAKVVSATTTSAKRGAASGGTSTDAARVR